MSTPNPVIDFNSHTDHYYGEARRFRFQKFATFPSTAGVPSGWIVEVNNKVYQWNGTAWVDLSQIYEHPEYPLTANPFANEQTSGLQILTQLLFSNGHITKVGARNLTNADIVSIFLNDAIQSGSFTWSSNKIKGFVENAIGQSMTGALVYQPSGYTPTTVEGSMTAPIPITSASIKQGMTWVVTSNGWVGNSPVSVGDMIIANTDNASNTPANYQIIEKGIPDIVDATEAVKGIIQLATDIEAIAGTNATKAMSPKSTKAILDSRLKENSWLFGDGSQVSFTFQHDWGTKSIEASVFRVADDKKIHVGITTPTINTVQVDILIPVGVNAYRIDLKTIF